MQHCAGFISAGSLYMFLNTPDDGRLRPKHVEWPCRNKTCTVLHQVGVSFEGTLNPDGQNFQNSYKYL